MTDRKLARRIARTHLERDDPLGWFEALYATSSGDPACIPWADLAPNPNLVSWLDEQAVEGQDRRALKIGCGLGDDAEELARRGFATTGFDISPTAVEWCRARFPESSVEYRVADLFAPPAEWARAFDLVTELYTLQVLPPRLRDEAIERVASFVAPGGTLLVVCRGREPGGDQGAMPWPLTQEELDRFFQHGLRQISFEDYVDQETPPVRRFRAVYGADVTER